MKGESLSDLVARARAQEAHESRLNKSEVPSPHLGRPPEPWETAIGDIGERVGRQGRAVIEYAARMEEIGVEETSLAGENNPIADHVGEMGRGKMRLLNGLPPSNRPRGALRGNIGMAIQEHESSTSSSGTSESSSDDTDSEDTSEAPPEAVTTQIISEPADPDCEDSGDVGLLDDTELRHAVEDFDSSNWTLEQLEASCQTLLEECYTSEDRRRRLLSSGMLVKLVETHPMAFRWMERNLEAVVNDGLPGMIKGRLDERVFRLDMLLGILAPAMAESMTQLRVMERALGLMVFKIDTAIRVIQFRYTLPKVLQACRRLPQAASAHKRMTLLKHGSALRTRWRNINSNEGPGALSPDVRHAHLCVIMALVAKETCPRYFRMNRVRAVGSSGLLALGTHLKAGDRSQRVACRVLRELAREPLLIDEILKIGLAGRVAKMLPVLREASMDRTLEALDALDSMAFSAMRFCVCKATVDAEGGVAGGLLRALVADGSDVGGLEAEINLPAGEKVEETIREQLGLSRIVTVLAGLLDETSAKLYMAGLVILGKMACTVCYHSVLQEILAYAGRALEQLIQGLQSQEELVPDISLALFLQLCSRQEGRDGIEASDGAKMLQPLISSYQASDSSLFLRGLACAIALARREDLKVTPGSLAAAGERLPRAGGVGLSGPARPHKLNLKEKLYNDLVELLDAPPPAPSESVQGLMRMGFLHAVMKFLVRDEAQGDGESCPGGVIGAGLTDVADASSRPTGPHGFERSPYYFLLPQRQACLGAVVLHGLVVLAGPQPVIFTGSTVRYLCYSIQVAYTDLTVGRLSPEVGHLLMFRSIQLACRALAFLATSEVPDASVGDGDGMSEATASHEEVKFRHGALRRVADSLRSTSAINEVACMAQMPSKGAWVADEESMYRHLERTVSLAALLIASICPVPAGEQDPFTRFDQPRDEKASLKQCQPLMEWLVMAAGRALCSTLMVTDSLDIISHTCRALSKLSATNTTVQILLDSHDLLKAITRLGPRAPAVLRSGMDEHEEKGCSVVLAGRGIACDDGDTPASKSIPNDSGTDRALGGEEGQHDAIKTLREISEYGRSPIPYLRRGDCGDGKEGCFSGRADVRGGDDKKNDPKEESNGYAERCWVGYEIPKEKMRDVSTRKLCSLPFDFFRLVANVARVPSGRADIQRSGILKRCLERFAISVSDCLDSRLATLRCRSEICVLIARMAGTYDRDAGAANDFILAPRYRVLRVLLGVMGGLLGATTMTSGDALVLSTARHNAASALAALCKDALRSIPVVAKAGGIELAAQLVKDPVHPMPFLKHVIHILRIVVSFPEGVYASSLTDMGLPGALNRIANNAYPGFRPGQTIEIPCPQGENSTKEWSTTGPSKAGKLERKNPPPPSAFGLPKPSSAEGRLIAELAREVAFSIGARKNRMHAKFGAGDTNTLPVGSGPHASSVSVSGKGISHSEADSGQLGDASTAASRGLGKPNEAKKMVPDGEEEPLVDCNSASQIEGSGTDLSGTLGTYVVCGVTTCGGLGAVGNHGDGELNTPHPSFVMRRVNDAEDAEHCYPGGAGEDHLDHGSIRRRAIDGESIPGARTDIRRTVSTPLTLLSARDPGFRAELIRRKKYYLLGGTGDGTGDLHGRRQVHSAPTPGKESAAREGSSPSDGTRGESPAHLEGRFDGVRDTRSCISAVSVNAASSPLFASTRPLGTRPTPDDSPHTTESNPEPDADHVVEPVKGGGTREPREFVKFARPAAHWAAMDDANDTPSRARDCRGVCKAGHPNDHVIGRFACRGYLLDPTFADHNHAIQQARPRYADSSGDMSNKVEQVPDGTSRMIMKPDASNMTKEARSRIVDRRGIEPYRNGVEVLRHHVKVLGARKAGKRRFFDEQGRPLSAVTFRNLDDCLQRRREEHTELDTIPFP